MTRKIIVLPNDACDGCNKCIEACVQALGSGSKNSGNQKAAIKIVNNESKYFPVICRNCQEAPCVAACMSGCIQPDEDGHVITDYDRCVGCWMCVMSCPFGAIEIDQQKHVTVKCNSCLDKGVAPCVAACEKDVLIQINIDEFTRQLRKEAARRFISGDREVIKK